jgi:hypothetical protein
MLGRGGVAVLGIAAVLGCGDDGWRQHASPGTYGVTAVWPFAPDDVWAGSQIMLHWNGASFTAVDTPPIGFVMGFQGFAPDDLYAVSASTLLHWDGVAWSAVDFDAAIEPRGLQAIWGTSGDDLWLGDSLNGQVHRWDGSQWRTYITQVVEVIDLWGSSSTDLYAAGRFGLSRWDGVAWSSITDPVADRAEGVWGTAADDVWAVGLGVLAHWDGATWTDHLADDDRFEDWNARVWGTAADDVWMVGDFGAISHWNGARWSQTLVGKFPYRPYLNAVHGSSADDVWVVGLSSDGKNTGVILHRGP